MQADFDRNVPFDVEESINLFGTFWRHPSILLHGLPFSGTLLIILLAHEFGHYFAALYHRVDASLPYFMPSPLMGTFGAFIRVRSPIYSKRVLFDIGIAGPVAGFVFLMPALSVGMALGKVIPHINDQGALQFGMPLLQWLMSAVIFPGVPTSDIYVHPIARAAWVGMLCTALNLMPIGQLDGGHIFYAFFPKSHKLVSKLFSIVLVVGGCAQWLLPPNKRWWGWIVWGIILLFLGRRHPIIDDPTNLTPGRKKLGVLALVVFILCFLYAPITEGGM